jgi:uncharacterized phage infection (PIP) family protein YhgE
LQNITSEILRIDKRSKEINKSLHKIENKFIELSAKMENIDEVKERFMQIESLIEDLENRHKQVVALNKKLEQVKESYKNIEDRLRKLVIEADDRAKKLGDLIKLYGDIDTKKSKKIKEDYEPEVYDTIELDELSTKDLYNAIIKLRVQHNWEPREIAKYLNVDEATVQFILNSSSL